MKTDTVQIEDLTAPKWVQEIERCQPPIVYQFSVWEDDFYHTHVNCINVPGKDYLEAIRDLNVNGANSDQWCDGCRMFERHPNGIVVVTDIGGTIIIYAGGAR